MRILIGLLACCLLLTACGRPLTERERAYARTFYGDQLDPDPVRFNDGHFARSVTFTYAARPRVTCQERVFPPVKGETFKTSPGAIAVYQNVFYRKDLYRPDFTHEYPQGTDLWDLMLFAHEMTHVWQWQNRDRTGYTPWRAASEHKPGHDPYLFELDSQPDFLSFPFEQQAAIVEEFTCCRALAPRAQRTKRLHAMLSEVMPVQLLQTRIDRAAVVPWKDADLNSICS